jgi:hypothetical protein
MRCLIKPGLAYDLRAIMCDAHAQWRCMGRRGWSWSRCLSFAWAKVRAERARMLAQHESSCHPKTPRRALKRAM